MLATRRRDVADIAYGFMASKTLFAALEIGLFSLLADGPRTGADLARTTGVAGHRLTTLLRALVALGLVIADDEGFRNAPAAQRHLVRGAPVTSASTTACRSAPDLPGAGPPGRRDRGRGVAFGGSTS